MSATNPSPASALFSRWLCGAAVLTVLLGGCNKHPAEQPTTPTTSDAPATAPAPTTTPQDSATPPAATPPAGTTPPANPPPTTQ